MSKLEKFAMTLAQVAIPRLRIFGRYARVELAPPKVTEVSQAIATVNKSIANYKSGGYKNLTVKDAFLNTLIGVEICFWFVLGEVIGRGTHGGYNVDGATNFEAHLSPRKPDED